MIVKFFELKKRDINKIKYFLLYGNNRGLIDETFNKTIKPSKTQNIYNYDENDILKNLDSFEETISIKSFFDLPSLFNDIS